MTTLVTVIVRELGWVPQRRHCGVSEAFQDADAQFSRPWKSLPREKVPAQQSPAGPLPGRPRNDVRGICSMASGRDTR